MFVASDAIHSRMFLVVRPTHPPQPHNARTDTGEWKENLWSQEHGGKVSHYKLKMRDVAAMLSTVLRDFLEFTPAIDLKTLDYSFDGIFSGVQTSQAFRQAGGCHSFVTACLVSRRQKYSARTYVHSRTALVYVLYPSPTDRENAAPGQE